MSERPNHDKIQQLSDSCLKRGTLLLCEVKAITRHQAKSECAPEYYQIVLNLVTSGSPIECRLAATDYHSFLVRDPDGEKRHAGAFMLGKGDQIFVQLGAFLADGCLYVKEKRDGS